MGIKNRDGGFIQTGFERNNHRNAMMILRGGHLL